MEVFVQPETKSIEGRFLRISLDINDAIQRFVRQYESQNQVIVRDYAVEKETLHQEGSYFLAGILRLSFVCESFDQFYRSSVILKVPALGAYRLNGEHLLCYKKEKFVYQTLFPMMYQSGPTNERPVPDFFGVTDLDTLVLENLRESGFYQHPNGTLLGTSTCQAVLEALARFHALSFEYVDSLSDALDSLTVADKGKCEWATKVFPVLVRKLRMYVLPFCSGVMRAKFDEYMCNCFSILQLGQLPNEGGFNVIIHGDLHHYNVMFKDDEETKTSECKLIDFQVCRRGSPILDVMLFLVTSVDCDVVKKDWRALFDCYLREFDSVRQSREPDWQRPYGMNDMLSDFEKYKLAFIYPLVSMVPFYWIGSVKRNPYSSDETLEAIDEVMKSQEYLSFFRGWIELLFDNTENCSN